MQTTTGRYLVCSYCSRPILILQWLFFVVGTMAFYGLDMLLNDNLDIMAWVWVGIGWMVFTFNLLFEHHLITVRDQFIPKGTLNSLQRSSNGEDRNSVSKESLESSVLLQTDETETEHLPAWCKVDLAHFMDVQRPRLSRLLVRGKPNRLQVSFWLDRHGQRFYLLILQMNLIFLGVYAALTLLAFLPIQKNKYGPFLFTIYVILATVSIPNPSTYNVTLLSPSLIFVLRHSILDPLSQVPGFYMIYQKKHLVATLAIVCSIGSYRKPQIVSDVLREKKTIRAVSTFIVISKMRQFAESLANASNGDGISIFIPLPVARPLSGQNHTSSLSSFTTFELAEVGKTFDMIDEDKSGFLTLDEFGAVFGRMGAHLTPQTLEAVVAQFDKDGNGQVARGEFLEWYSDQMLSEHLPPREQAKKLFRLFDSDSDGEITIGEFKNKVDALHLDFTVDDIGAIVNELDRARTGSVSAEEFEKLFEKYTSET
jgi:Ca2+-binding EF-hand superfamily protein